MLVSKWGNSLAVRLPADLVRKLDLKEGDNLELVVEPNGADGKTAKVEKKETIAEMLRRIKGSLGPLPADYKFNREELHERGKDLP